MKVHTLLLLSCLVLLVEPYKILMYTNLFGHSHIKMLGAVSDVLTDSGHDVTVLMPVMDATQINKTAMKTTKKVIMIEPHETVTKMFETMTDFMKDLWKSDNSNPLVMFFKAGAMSQLFGNQCRVVLSDKKLIEQLKAENFDLAITEPFDTCAYHLFDAINVRAHVAVLASGRLDHVSDAFGQPSLPSYVPSALSVHGDKMTFWQRFMNSVQSFTGGYVFATIGDHDYKVAKEIHPNIRSWRETLPEASFLFTNQVPFLDFPAPTFDKIIPIGGVSVKTGKKDLKLPARWDKVLSLRKKNVFISFGSNAKSIHMPQEYKNSLLEVFKSMPDTTFIWKYENEKDTIVDHLDNVVLGDWLPQNELLGDPRLTVFVTHGGLASVTELAYMGKPAVMIPLFADQGRNAVMLKRHGGAEVINKFDLSNSKLIKETLEKVMANKKYDENAKRLADMLNNQPTDPKQTLVKYVEFAAKFGKLPTMDNQGRHMGYIEYFNLDVIALVLVVIAVVLYVTVRVNICLFRKCFGKPKPKTE